MLLFSAESALDPDVRPSTNSARIISADGLPNRQSDVQEGALKTAKDEVRELLEGLPDDASLEDIQYHLYVRQKIQRGLDAAAQGRTMMHEEATRRMSRWLEK